MKRSVGSGAVLITLVATSCLALTAPASAGGSNWTFDREHYEPGDTVGAWAAIAWEHNPDLGTPEEGPYLAYLVPYTRDAEPGVPQTYVGNILVSLEPYDVGFGRFGPHHAEITFRVPALPPGHYNLVVANAAGKSIGDLTDGFLWIDASSVRASPRFTG
jgi:hypothetical protein